MREELLRDLNNQPVYADTKRRKVKRRGGPMGLGIPSKQKIIGFMELADGLSAWAEKGRAQAAANAHYGANIWHNLGNVLIPDILAAIKTRRANKMREARREEFGDEDWDTDRSKFVSAAARILDIDIP